MRSPETISNQRSDFVNTTPVRHAIQLRGESTTGTATEEAPTEERLDEIEGRYRDMILTAREKGHDVAADNLQRFLDGTGGTRTLEVSWLRGFSAVTSAERTNQERFESSLTSRAQKLADGQTETFTDYWDRQFTASVTTELYYASGTSTIRSTGRFTLSRSGDTVTITGTVDHHWYDPYDWHANLSAYIPGFGSISDADALLLETHRGAKSFHMEADWQQSVTGTVTIRDWWFDSSDYEWSGP